MRTNNERSYEPSWRPASCSFGSQVLVFHFPGVIERVKRGMPNQVPERPGTGHFALDVQRPNRVAIGVAMRGQSLVAQHRVLGCEHAEPLGPVKLVCKRMMDDLVPISP